MSHYEDFEATQRAARRSKEEKSLDLIECPTCGSRWFEQVEFARFKKEHRLVLGQRVPYNAGDVPFQMLRCVHCQHLVEPHTIRQARDLGSDGYDNFLDTVEGLNDTRNKDKIKDEVPSEKL